MKKTITPGQISQTNRELIYQYIYHKGPVSQQDISYDLRLSRPTVTSKLSELEALGMVKKEGQISSDQVGRKAAAYTIVPDYRVAIGVEILEKQIKILTVDLTGAYSLRKVLPLPYANTEEYIQSACGRVNEYIEALSLDSDRILGVGFSIPGLVSADGSEITYGKILDCTGLKLDRFQKHLHYPCRFLHDAASAAGSELWASPELPDFVYLNISIHLGAAMISGREILSGQHGFAATIEHVQIDPRGTLCYCGKRGCVETLCSMTALLGEDDEEEFFRLLRSGDRKARTRWHKYLQSLARVINNSHLLYDTIFILGGYLASQLLEEDIELLYDEIQSLSPFRESRDFIRISKMPKHNITIGAALPYIREFLDNPNK